MSIQTEYDLENDPRDNGCLCQRCDRRYFVDLMLPDALWHAVHDGYVRLCGRCVVELLEARGADHFDLVKLEDLNSQPKRKSKKIQIEEALRRSDLTAQISGGRDDVEYGHHDQLPRGEHVARLSKQQG